MDPKPIAEVFGGLYLSDDQSVMGMNRPFWAQLTDVDYTTGLYAWTEQDYGTVDPTTWIDRPGGRSGTLTSSPAYDANGVIPNVPSYVLLQRAFFDATYADTYVIVWCFGSSVPPSSGGILIVDYPIIAVGASSTVVVNDTTYFKAGDVIEIFSGSYVVYGQITSITNATDMVVKVVKIALGAVTNIIVAGSFVIVCCPIFPGLPVKDGSAWNIMYIDNSIYLQQNANFTFNTSTSTFSVVENNVYFDITTSKTVNINVGGTTVFYADGSDSSIKIGWPSKATSDTSKYAYWHYVAGKPTGAVPSKSGYWAWLWDSTNYRSWFYAQSVSKWLLECCWIIVKKSSNYTAEYGDFIWGDTSGGGVDIDLPSPLLNQEIKIKTDTLTNPLRVTGTGIGTNVPLTLQNMTYDFYSDGTNWYTDDVEPAIPYGTATGDMLVWNDSAQEWQILDAPTVDGYVLTADSGETLKMKWAPSCCYEPFTVTYDADDTFTPTFTGYVEVEVWGAGGGGYGDVTKGGGGGGGAYAKLNSYAVTSGNNYTVNVGAAGGDDSFFVDSSTVMAKSAVDATTASGTAGGSAGSSVGDVKFSGGSGANASGADTGGGGGGSAGDAGNGGNASTITGGTAGTAGGGAGGNGGTGGSSGANGSVPGGGGGGNSLSSPPGNGGHGRVIITRIS